MYFVLSTAVVSTVGLVSKAFLNSGLCSLSVSGLHHLQDALSNPRRNAGQGIITGEPPNTTPYIALLIIKLVCNHISTYVDDSARKT